MNRARVCSSLAAAAFIVACGEPANVAGERESLPAPGSFRIVVGPEVRVSRDPNRPHTELLIAASPRDVNNLVAAAMTSPARAGGFSVTVFSSHDAGNTWTSYEPPRLQEAGGSDELLAFGPTGTAYFLPNVSPLTNPPQPGERPGYDMYRSADGGTTWSLSQTQAASGDRPMAAVDLTRGPHRGNLYLTVEGRVFRSTDDGRTMTDTFTLPTGGMLVGGVRVLSDGSVLAVLSDRAPGASSGNIALVRSLDGGKTWGSPTPVPLRALRQSISPRGTPPSRGLRESDLGLGAFSLAVTADTAVHSAYRDRIYVAWIDFRGDRSRILMTASGDLGRTWAEPAAITPDNVSFQFLPTIATNKDGVLGVLYDDTQGFRAEDGRFNAWFVASVDGGASFLAPRRLASRPSTIETEAHERPGINHVWPYVDSVSVWVASILTKHPTGGDYVGLAADIAGFFHPLWADSRSGVYQAYTSQVAVLRDSALAARGSELSGPVAVNSRITLEVDEIAYDATRRVATMPVRLRNLSTDTVWGPINVRVKAIGYRGVQPEASSGWTVLNAENGVSGVGALFVYSSALGDLGLLPPSGVSSPVEWRARFPQLRARHVRLQFEVVGRVRK